MSKVKRCDVVVKGRVQDVSYRKRVESTADLLQIRGYDFNDLEPLR
jgi:acylphosphatase